MTEASAYKVWPHYYERPTSRSEGRQRLEELRSIEPDRIRALLDHLTMDSAGWEDRPPAIVYGEAAGRLCLLLRSGALSWPGPGPMTVQLRPGPATVDPGPGLTEAGEALAADLGLLFARALRYGNEDRLPWDIVERPRLDVSYLRPVVKGLGAMYSIPSSSRPPSQLVSYAVPAPVTRSPTPWAAGVISSHRAIDGVTGSC